MTDPNGQATPGADAQDEIQRRLRKLRSGRSAPKAGRALGELGAAAVSALVEALADKNPFVRSGALHGLEAAASLGADVVDHVIESLVRDEDLRVQETACGVLQRLGESAVIRGEMALRAAEESRDPRVVAAAKSALAAIG